MRILLTGSSGWLGKFLAPRLRASGHSVIGLDIAPGEDTTIVGTVADRALVNAALRDHAIDAVVHAGALHKPDIVRFSVQDFIDTNVSGTANLLEAAVACQVNRFVFTSTTSLMISQAIRDEEGDEAVWLDEHHSPIEPRNIYGITKLAAEGLCRLTHRNSGLPIVILRTSRFFPEEDDIPGGISGENTKAAEFLYRRLTAEDAAEAHVAALEKSTEAGFALAIVSAPPPFSRADAAELKRDAAAVIARYFPDAPALFAQRGWQLPRSIGRIYDPARAEAVLGFRCRTDFAAILEALREERELPFDHDPGYVSPATLA